MSAKRKTPASTSATAASAPANKTKKTKLLQTSTVNTTTTTTLVLDLNEKNNDGYDELTNNPCHFVIGLGNLSDIQQFLALGELIQTSSNLQTIRVLVSKQVSLLLDFEEPTLTPSAIFGTANGSATTSVGSGTTSASASTTSTTTVNNTRPKEQYYFIIDSQQSAGERVLQLPINVLYKSPDITDENYSFVCDLKSMAGVVSKMSIEGNSEMKIFEAFAKFSCSGTPEKHFRVNFLDDGSCLGPETTNKNFRECSAWSKLNPSYGFEYPVEKFKENLQSCFVSKEKYVQIEVMHSSFQNLSFQQRLQTHEMASASAFAPGSESTTKLALKENSTNASSTEVLQFDFFYEKTYHSKAFAFYQPLSKESSATAASTLTEVGALKLFTFNDLCLKGVLDSKQKLKELQENKRKIISINTLHLFLDGLFKKLSMTNINFYFFDVSEIVMVKYTSPQLSFAFMCPIYQEQSTD